MLEHSDQIHGKGFMLGQLKRLQFVLSKNNLKKSKEDEIVNFAKLDRLPTETLVLIFSYLNFDDLSRTVQGCQRFRQIYNAYRPLFAYKKVNALAVRFGFWRDVIKQRIVSEQEQTTLSYRLLNDNFGVQEPKRARRSGFFNSHCEKKRPSFNGIVQNCIFESAIIITVEMLNGEIRNALRLEDLKTPYIYVDFSHHSLQLRAIQRYLPGLSEDLNNNPYIKNVDFIFQKRDDASNLSIKTLLNDRMDCKKVTVIFLRSRCS